MRWFLVFYHTWYFILNWEAVGWLNQSVAPFPNCMMAPKKEPKEIIHEKKMGKYQLTSHYELHYYLVSKIKKERKII